MTHDTHDQPSQTLAAASQASRRRLLTMIGAAPLSLGLAAIAAPHLAAKKKRRKKKGKGKKGKGGKGPKPDPEPDEKDALLELINDHRASNGLAALARNDNLDDAAQAHSQDMADRNYFSHNSPEGDGPPDRMTAAGYTHDWWGENIYRGGESASEAFNWWKDSPGHNSNMLSANFEEIGIGRALRDESGQWYWTTVFGSPA